MTQPAQSSNDFCLAITLRIEGSNCLQLVLRLVAGITTLAVVGSRVAMWLAANGG